MSLAENNDKVSGVRKQRIFAFFVHGLVSIGVQLKLCIAMPSSVVPLVSVPYYHHRGIIRRDMHACTYIHE